ANAHVYSWIACQAAKHGGKEIAVETARAVITDPAARVQDLEHACNAWLYAIKDQADLMAELLGLRTRRLTEASPTIAGYLIDVGRADLAEGIISTILANPTRSLDTRIKCCELWHRAGGDTGILRAVEILAGNRWLTSAERAECGD